jgi:hypothetical protein
MKRKFKQWWSAIPTNINRKQTITSHLSSFNIKKTKTYEVRNLRPYVGQAITCGSVKLCNGIPTLALLIIGYPDTDV